MAGIGQICRATHLVIALVIGACLSNVCCSGDTSPVAHAIMTATAILTASPRAMKEFGMMTLQSVSLAFARKAKRARNALNLVIAFPTDAQDSFQRHVLTRAAGPGSLDNTLCPGGLPCCR